MSGIFPVEFSVGGFPYHLKNHIAIIVCLLQTGKTRHNGGVIFPSLGIMGLPNEGLFKPLSTIVLCFKKLPTFYSTGHVAGAKEDCGRSAVNYSHQGTYPHPSHCAGNNYR